LAAAGSAIGCNGILGVQHLSADGTADRGDAAADGTIGGGQDAADGTIGGGQDAADGTVDGGDGAGRACLVPEADAGSPLPPIADASHLHLWLTADWGVTCDENQFPHRVTRWADRSGQCDDASLLLKELGPQCQLSPGAHTINGIDVPYFSAPTNGNVVDETLDVDLSFLALSEYTIFVVERRWADQPPQGPHASFLIGTTAPDPVHVACGGGTDTDQALQFGFIYYNGFPQLALDQTCCPSCGGVTFTVLAVPTPPPAATSYDVVGYSRSGGHHLRVNGVHVADDVAAPGEPLHLATGGAIGRALFAQTVVNGGDDRFVGDIAEVLVYDAALTQAEESAIEQYMRSHWGL
jgi:hypothetical protein